MSKLKQLAASENGCLLEIKTCGADRRTSKAETLHVVCFYVQETDAYLSRSL
jgi:hypothetical protein